MKERSEAGLIVNWICLKNDVLGVKQIKLEYNFILYWPVALSFIKGIGPF